MTTKKPKETDKELVGELKRAIRNVLKNPKASRRDKIEAITAGTKLLLVEHKIKGGGDDGDFFDG